VHDRRRAGAIGRAQVQDSLRSTSSFRQISAGDLTTRGAATACNVTPADSDGNGYISDGYINARIAKVSKSGEWLGSRGSPGTDPGRLITPHSIAVDAKNNVYVADRGNRRIQVFDTNGTLLRVMTIDVPYDPDAKPADRQQAETVAAARHAADHGARIAMGDLHHPGPEPGAV
jgi:NHL repeat